MPLYQYKAKDIQGVEHKGTIEIGDEHQVASLLIKHGLVVISIKQAQEPGKGPLDQFLGRVSFTAVVVMTRQLATMIESGLVLSEALDILSDQQDNKHFKQILDNISSDVKSGIELSSAFKKHPEVFNPLYCNLIRAGESSGKLDVVLTQMANNLERDREFRSRIRGAMIYPIIVITMMGIVMTIMMVFVIPKLTTLYTQSSIQLPLPTRILIFISNIFINQWWLMIMVLFGSIFGIKKWTSNDRGKFQFDQLVLKVPIISKIIQGTSLTNFTRTFGLLTTAGIPILDSLSIVSEVLGNLVYRNAIAECVKGVERGLTLSDELERVGVFPKIVPQMFRVGEETGKVDQVSFKLAEYFEAETDHLVKNLTVVLEPVILVVLGLGVAFLVLSIILPIYKLTTAFS